MRILSIIGTRPEALKMGPVLQQLARTRGISSYLCVTGQHRQLLQLPLTLWGLRPDFDLRLMRRAQSPEAVLARILTRLGPVIERVQPDWILGAGDTTTVLAASLAAAHHQVRFGHVEAGLRTPEKWDPFPEEFNRRLISVLADLHFAPTTHARQNLRRENIPARRIVITGNPIIDALKQFAGKPVPAPTPAWCKQIFAPSRTTRLIVVTFHRRENIGRPLRNICAALRDLAALHQPSLKILCIIHPNPAVRDPARQALANLPNLILARPISYPLMIAVLQRAHLVLTDSGGLQEEAPWLRVPLFILRRTSERPEGIRAGVARLIGTERRAIVTAVTALLVNPRSHAAMSRGFTGYGDGKAAHRIITTLLENHGRKVLPSASSLPSGAPVRT